MEINLPEQSLPAVRYWYIHSKGGAAVPRQAVLPVMLFVSYPGEHGVHAEAPGVSVKEFIGHGWQTGDVPVAEYVPGGQV